MSLPPMSKKRAAAIKDGTYHPKPRKAMKRTKMDTKRKPTGEAKVFAEIWNERPHECEVCSAEITEPMAHNFSHILPKGSYPRLRHDKLNIFLKCALCHDRWHQHGAEGFRYSFLWRHVVQRHDQLKLAYHQRLNAELSGRHELRD